MHVFATSLYCELHDRWRPYMEYIPYRLAALLAPYTAAIPLSNFWSAKQMNDVIHWDLAYLRGPQRRYRVYWYDRAQSGTSGRYLFRWWNEDRRIVGCRTKYVQQEKYFSVEAVGYQRKESHYESRDPTSISRFATRLEALDALSKFAISVDRPISETDLHRYRCDITSSASSSSVGT